MRNRRPAFDENRHPIEYESDAYIVGYADGSFGFAFAGERSYGGDHVRYWNYRKGYEQGRRDPDRVVSTMEPADAEDSVNGSWWNIDCSVRGDENYLRGMLDPREHGVLLRGD